MKKLIALALLVGIVLTAGCMDMEQNFVWPEEDEDEKKDESTEETVS